MMMVVECRRWWRCFHTVLVARQAGTEDSGMVALPIYYYYYYKFKNKLHHLHHNPLQQVLMRVPVVEGVFCDAKKPHQTPPNTF
jgi:hypothetical protein